MWITNSQISDVFVIWTRSRNDPDHKAGTCIRGFILEKGMPGLTAPKIEGKLSLRASPTRRISMNEVEVGEEHRMPLVKSSCLFGISWGVMGAAEDCFHSAFG